MVSVTLKCKSTKAQREVEVELYSFFTSALEGVGGQHPAPAALPPGKTPTLCTGGWVGPRAGLDVCEKSRPHRDFFCTIVDLFYLFDPLVVRVTNMGQIILLPLPKEGML
jgi:hypothetical protein